MRLRDDIEAFHVTSGRREGSGLNHRGSTPPREKHVHRKVVIPPRHKQNGHQLADTECAAGLADSCALEEVSRVRGPHPCGKRAARLVGASDSPEGQPPESQAGEKSRSGDGHGELSRWCETSGSSEQQQPCASSDQRAMGLWRKTLRRMKSTVRPPKGDANQARQHPSGNAREDRDTGNGDEQGWSETNSWALWGLLRRVRRSSSLARDPNQWQQQQQHHPGNSDEGGHVMTNNSEQSATSGSASPERLIEPEPEPEPEKEHAVDIGNGEQQQQPVRPETDDRSQPGSGMQAVRGRCDKSACRYCKGKGVGGRGEQSPCRAADACTTARRVIP